MYCYIQIFYLVSSLASAFSVTWDSPVCLTCHDAASITALVRNTSVEQVGNATASSSLSSSKESDTSEYGDVTAATTGASSPTTETTVSTTDRSTASTTTTPKTTTKDRKEISMVRQPGQKNSNKKNPIISTDKSKKKNRNKNILRILSIKSDKEFNTNHESHSNEDNKGNISNELQSEVDLKVKEVNNQLVEWQEQLMNNTQNVMQNQTQDIILSEMRHESDDSLTRLHNKQNNNKNEEDETSQNKIIDKIGSRNKENVLISDVKQDQLDNLGIEIRSKHKQKRYKLKKTLKDTTNIDYTVTQSKHKHKKYVISKESRLTNNHAKIKKSVKKTDINTDQELAENNHKHKKATRGIQKHKIKKELDNRIYTDDFGTRIRHKKEKHKIEKVPEYNKYKNHNGKTEKRHKHKQKKHQTKDKLRENIDNIETTTHTKRYKNKTETVESVEMKTNKFVHGTHKTLDLKYITRQGSNHNNEYLPTTKYYDIPFSPHKIKEDEAIKAFSKRILIRTLKLFENVRKNCSEYQWKKKVKHLAENYEHKFKEFLRSSAQHSIKTKLGTQKVVLNAIDMSKQIANRLLNIMIDDIDKKGMLRTSRTQDLIYTELKKEIDSELNDACSKLGICSARNGFIQLVLDVISAMLSLNDERLREAFDSLTDVVEFTDFSHTLGHTTDAQLKKKIRSMEQDDVKIQRAMLTIMKNVLLNRNKPLVMYPDSDAKSSNVNGTLAFLEIIDILDKAVPSDDTNNKQWFQIRENMMQWSNGISIQSTITQFVKYIKTIVDGLDSKNYDAVLKNFAKML